MCAFLRRILPAVLLLFVLAPQAKGGTITLPLPDLVGTYQYNSLGTPPSGCAKTATLETTWGLYQVTEAHLVIEGSFSAGRVTGDGVLRQAEEVALNSDFSNMYIIGYNGFGFLDRATSGAFTVSGDFIGPFDRYLSIPPPPGPLYFTATIQMALNTQNSLWGPPAFFVPPAEGTPWYEGLVLVDPATATVTSAYLVLEGPNVPEPATLALLALGGLMALGRRARH